MRAVKCPEREDLRMGGAMLGSCGEFDVIGELWGGARDAWL